jgi:hypothetical protein
LSRGLDYIPSIRGKNAQKQTFPECVHLLETCECDILDVAICVGESCSFCQTERQAHDSNAKWASHMNALSIEKQKKIAKAYFKGKMPWSDDLPHKRQTDSK